MIVKRIQRFSERLATETRRMTHRMLGGRFFRVSYPCDCLARALPEKPKPTDISDHLGAIFHFALDSPPGLIVELGTRGGESTRALLAAAELRDSRVLSVDLDECDPKDLPYRERWTFVQADDVAFAQGPFAEWCRENGLPCAVSVLFLDTSHEYDHTVQELAFWMPLLKDGGALILHDTNMGQGAYARSDGSVGVGWDNRRGVIRAVEEMLGRQYDENTLFTDFVGGFLVWHSPYCNGLTMLRRAGEAGCR